MKTAHATASLSNHFQFHHVLFHYFSAVGQLQVLLHLTWRVTKKYGWLTSLPHLLPYLIASIQF